MRYMIHSFRMLMKSALQYRSSLVMQVIAQIVLTGGELLAVTVLLSRFRVVGHWGAMEIMFFFGVMQSSFALTELFGRGVAAFSGFVGRGEFDSLLLRPRPLLVQVLCSQLDPRRIGSFSVGLAAIVISASRLDIAWTLGKALLMAEVIVCSMLLTLGLFMIEATMCFFSVKSIEMANVLTYGGRSTCQYPVDIFPKPLELLFTWVAPFALCMHWPVSVVLGRPMAEMALGWYYVTPLAGVAFFALMTRVWYWGVKQYRSTGT